MTEEEVEEALSEPLWDYVAKNQEAVPGYNLDASGKREIKTGSLVRLSDKGMVDSRYETSYLYKDAGIKTLFGKVIHVAENGEIRVEFEDLLNNPDGPVRVCSHDWLIVER
jgi:outer membrane lipoprotein-sorting protein